MVIRCGKAQFVKAKLDLIVHILYDLVWSRKGTSCYKLKFYNEDKGREEERKEEKGKGKRKRGLNRFVGMEDDRDE